MSDRVSAPVEVPRDLVVMQRARLLPVNPHVLSGAVVDGLTAAVTRLAEFHRGCADLRCQMCAQLQAAMALIVAHDELCHEHAHHLGATDTARHTANRAAMAWNEVVAPGAPVRFWAGCRDESPQVGVTEDLAFVRPGHGVDGLGDAWSTPTAMVRVRGQISALPLSHVDPLEPALAGSDPTHIEVS